MVIKNNEWNLVICNNLIEPRGFCNFAVVRKGSKYGGYSLCHLHWESQVFHFYMRFKPCSLMLFKYWRFYSLCYLYCLYHSFFSWLEIGKKWLRFLKPPVYYVERYLGGCSILNRAYVEKLEVFFFFFRSFINILNIDEWEFF